MAPSYRLGTWMEKADRWFCAVESFSLATLISKLLIKQVVLERGFGEENKVRSVCVSPLP